MFKDKNNKCLFHNYKCFFVQVLTSAFSSRDVILLLLAVLRTPKIRKKSLTILFIATIIHKTMQICKLSFTIYLIKFR